MFPFLTIFIIFCLILGYYIKKNDNSQKDIMDEFFEKERLSNSVRKKDLSQLTYISIPLDKIPYRLDTDTEKKFLSFSEKTMVNFDGISNTDLKLQYGTANLKVLTEYDTNYLDMIALLPEYAEELQQAGYTDAAQFLLEFAIETKANSVKIYRQLLSIYKENGQTEKISHLLESSATLPTLTRTLIEKDLSAID